jgi:hypothetical protein
MKRNTFLTALMVLSTIALFTTSWKTIPISPKKQWVSITGTYDFSTFPNTTGSYVTSGALNLSGYTTMYVGSRANGNVAHCVVTLYAPDGTITIHQQCEFSTNPPKGQWRIVSGTGAYTNLKGNGSLLMPPNQEAMTGYIYNQ